MAPPSTYLAMAPLNRIAQPWTKLVNSYFGHGETMCLFLYWYIFLLGQERTSKMLICTFHIVKFANFRFFWKIWPFWNVHCVLILKARSLIFFMNDQNIYIYHEIFKKIIFVHLVVAGRGGHMAPPGPPCNSQTPVLIGLKGPFWFTPYISANSTWIFRNFKLKLLCYKPIIPTCLFAILGDYPMS